MRVQREQLTGRGVVSVTEGKPAFLPGLIGEGEPVKKPSKYRNKRCGKYASKKEATRAAVLHALEKAGKIFSLYEQSVYSLEVNGIVICKYIADFDYWVDGKHVVEDVKGFKTPVYRLKKKMLKAIYGIEIRET